MTAYFVLRQMSISYDVVCNMYQYDSKAVVVKVLSPLITCVLYRGFCKMHGRDKINHRWNFLNFTRDSLFRSKQKTRAGKCVHTSYTILSQAVLHRIIYLLRLDFISFFVYIQRYNSSMFTCARCVKNGAFVDDL
jgi:hypothetical protein